MRHLHNVTSIQVVELDVDVFICNYIIIFCYLDDLLCVDGYDGDGGYMSEEFEPSAEFESENSVG